MGRTSLVTATLVALVTGALACGCATAEAAPAVRPVNIVLVNAGGADPPNGEYVDLVVSCGNDLRDGRDADCERAATEASRSPDPELAALGDTLLYVAQVNQGRYDLSEETLERLRRRLEAVHPSSRRPLTELVYRAEAVAFAASGDQDAADDATRRAQEAAPEDRAAEIAAERCRAAPDASSCRATTTTATSSAPTGTPTTGRTTTSRTSTPERTDTDDGGEDQQQSPPSN